jgi:hypothetical protein
MKLRIINGQHHSACSLNLADDMSHVTARTAKQLRALLCGAKDCDCFKKLRAVTLEHGQ